MGRQELSGYYALGQLGQVVYFSHPIFKLYAEHGNDIYAESVICEIKKIIKPTIAVEAPKSVEVFAKRSNNCMVLALLNYIPIQKGAVVTIDQAQPLYQCRYKIKDTWVDIPNTQGQILIEIYD